LARQRPERAQVSPPHRRVVGPRGEDLGRLYTLSEVETRTGAPQRALRHWADAGAFRAVADTMHAGRGVHRLFPPWEVEIASLLTPLEGRGLTIGQAVRLGSGFRQALQIHQMAELTGSLERFDARQLVYIDAHLLGQTFARARQGIGTNWLAVVDIVDPPYLRQITDAEGVPPSFNPSEDLPGWIDRKRATVLMIDLNARLAHLLDDRR
jgi:hypothetical protein